MVVVRHDVLDPADARHGGFNRESAVAGTCRSQRFRDKRFLQFGVGLLRIFLTIRRLRLLDVAADVGKFDLNTDGAKLAQPDLVPRFDCLAGQLSECCSAFV